MYIYVTIQLMKTISVSQSDAEFIVPVGTTPGQIVYKTKTW